MDGKGFFLGLIAAIALFLLWKKEQAVSVVAAPGLPAAPLSPTVGGCTGCGGPSAAAAPVAQGSPRIVVSGGGDGFITPGTPPLNNATGAGSFYAPSGSTPDTGFTSYPLQPSPVFSTPAATPNVPGSPTTPATNVPARAVQTVDGYATLGGFQQRWNLAGVPRPVAENLVN